MTDSEDDRSTFPKKREPSVSSAMLKSIRKLVSDFRNHAVIGSTTLRNRWRERKGVKKETRNRNARTTSERQRERERERGGEGKGQDPDGGRLARGPNDAGRCLKALGEGGGRERGDAGKFPLPCFAGNRRTDLTRI